jgi:hypothetical protein
LPFHSDIDDAANPISFSSGVKQITYGSLDGSLVGLYF